MADAKTRFIMEAVDNASKIINNVGGSIGKAGGQFKDFADQIPGLNQALSLMTNPITLVGAGIAAAGKFAVDATNETLEYNKTIRELATNLNLTTEETSRLVQTADDFTVSQTDLTVALEMALKNGFSPTIDTLANMADAYNNINDPTERAAKLTEVFGRNWAALTPMLKEGGQAIRDAAASQSDALIVTNQASKATREYEFAMDALGDSMTGIKLAVGNALIPALTDAANAVNDRITYENLWKQAADRGLLTEARRVTTSKDVAKNIAGLTKLIEDYDTANKETFQNVIDLTLGTQNLTDEEKMRAVVMAQTSAAQDDANKKTAEAIVMVHGYGRAFFDAADAISSDYIPRITNAMKEVPTTLNMNLNLASSIDNFIKEIEFQAAGGGKIQQAFEDVKRLWLVDQAITEEEALAYFGQLEVAANSTMVSIGEMTKQEAATAIAEGLNISYAEAWKMIGQPVQDVLDNINKDIKLNVEAHIFVTGDRWVEGVIMNQPTTKTNATTPEARAAGGPVAAGAAYVVGEHGPELFVPRQAGQIVPNHITNNWGGININGSGNMSPQDVARAIGREFDRRR